MKWAVAILNFATDFFFSFLAVAKSSNQIVAADQVLGWRSFASQPSQPTKCAVATFVSQPSHPADFLVADLPRFTREKGVF
jgi:hypothetical protein